MANDQSKKKLTSADGRPISDSQNSLTAGPRGPLLMQDVQLQEQMQHFNRERIPERVVHAKGSGAYGTFTVTNDITQYTKAAIFSEVGKETEMFARFSTVAGERGAADAERDPRGFALKFYTEEGNWDLVGNNTPVFFVRDPYKFQNFIHTQKRDPKTNMRDMDMQWDFWSHSPESLHQVTILMSDRGIPRSYRHMNGYGSHTYSFWNEEGERFWVKFHFKTQQGIKFHTNREAEEILVKGLERLEYRGYDSAGVAVEDGTGLQIRKKAGKLDGLTRLLQEQPVEGTMGIAHTRWATHGAPTTDNAHPHHDCSGTIAVVHNGIIENFRELRREIAAAGYNCETDTDSETVARLAQSYRREGLSPVDAAWRTIARLDGAFALCFLFEGEDDLLVATRKGSPLAIGHGDGEVLVGSDAIALAPLTNDVTYLEEGDLAVLRRGSVEIYDGTGQPGNADGQPEPGGLVAGQVAEVDHQVRCEDPVARGDESHRECEQAEPNEACPLDDADRRWRFGIGRRDP